MLWVILCPIDVVDLKIEFGGGGSPRILTEISICATEVDAVIFLDCSGVDLSSNPLHPASKLFDSRSPLELQYIYIQKLPILLLTNNLRLVVNLNSRILLL